MPDAQTFRSLADELDAAAIEIAQAARGVTGADATSFVQGGRISAVVEAAIDATASNVTAAVASLGVLAGECRSRAAVCDQFRAEMLQYERAYDTYADTPLADRGHPPIRPTAPSWADWR